MHIYEARGNRLSYRSIRNLSRHVCNGRQPIRRPFNHPFHHHLLTLLAYSLSHAES